MSSERRLVTHKGFNGVFFFADAGTSGANLTAAPQRGAFSSRTPAPAAPTTPAAAAVSKLYRYGRRPVMVAATGHLVSRAAEDLSGAAHLCLGDAVQALVVVELPGEAPDAPQQASRRPGEDAELAAFAVHLHERHAVQLEEREYVLQGDAGNVREAAHVQQLPAVRRLRAEDSSDPVREVPPAARLLPAADASVQGPDAGGHVVGPRVPEEVAEIRGVGLDGDDPDPGVELGQGHGHEARVGPDVQDHVARLERVRLEAVLAPPDVLRHGREVEGGDLEVSEGHLLLPGRVELHLVPEGAARHLPLPGELPGGVRWLRAPRAPRRREARLREGLRRRRREHHREASAAALALEEVDAEARRRVFAAARLLGGSRRNAFTIMVGALLVRKPLIFRKLKFFVSPPI